MLDGCCDYRVEEKICVKFTITESGGATFHNNPANVWGLWFSIMLLPMSEACLMGVVITESKKKSAWNLRLQSLVVRLSIIILPMSETCLMGVVMAASKNKSVWGQNKKNAPLHHLLAAGAVCAVCVCKPAARLDLEGSSVAVRLAHAALHTLPVGE
jgi:hypothetical protein